MQYELTDDMNAKHKSDIAVGCSDRGTVTAQFLAVVAAVAVAITAM